jgi:hypothetical protein
MHVTTHGRIRQTLGWVTIGLLLLLVRCASLWGGGRQPKMPEVYQATREAEAHLTLDHGADVRDLIETYESRWLSLDAYRDPSIQADLATGPYLDYWSLQRLDLTNEPAWYITKSAFARSISVLEYSGQRIKATACVIRETVDVLPSGEVLNTLPPREICGVYVFAQEDTDWKLAGYFNLLDRRDWEYAQPWLKEIIGDLPEGDP